jgi:hypothetical protein
VTMNAAHRSRREGSARRREERPIPVAKLRPVDRASEHLHLMAEDGILQLELGDAPTSGEHRDEGRSRGTIQGARIVPTSVNQSGTEFWSLTRGGPP